MKNETSMRLGGTALTMNRGLERGKAACQSPRRPLTLTLSPDGGEGTAPGTRDGWPSAFGEWRRTSVRRYGAGFTLIELLVVISIMGLIAGLAVPALRNMGKSNIQAGAERQLMDDIGRARLMAISQHTTVYMVFVTTNFFNLVDTYNFSLSADLNTLAHYQAGATVVDQQYALTTLTNLVDKQLLGYNFVSYGKVGDQPGQHSWHYLLSSWQVLPQGAFVAAYKFLPRTYYTVIPQWQADYGTRIDGLFNYNNVLKSQIVGFAADTWIPFPTEKSPSVLVPYIAFDSTGRLISEFDGANYHHAYIPLAQGTVRFGYDVNKQPTLAPVTSVPEMPITNSTSIGYRVIDVDPLSGRATLMYHHLP